MCLVLFVGFFSVLVSLVFLFGLIVSVSVFLFIVVYIG